MLVTLTTNTDLSTLFDHPASLTRAVERLQSAAVEVTDEREELRLAELVAALSLAVDLGLGQPMEHLLRSCLIALRLADQIGLDEQERAVVYYVALLGWVGCHADGHEQAIWFGDDIVLKADRFPVDM